MNKTSPPTPKQANMRDDSRLHSPTLLLVVLLAAVGALLYASFLFSPETRGDWIPYIIVIIAEFFIISQAIFAMWTILAGAKDARTFEYHNAQESLLNKNGYRRRYEEVASEVNPQRQALQINSRQVKIDVFITAYGEPLKIIEKTAIAARNMVGAHTTQILDDGGSDAVADLARKLNIGYIRRPNNEGAKAGNVNYALTKAKGEFFVIFDADFIAEPNFLYETVPFFEDELVAFVQTPQHYSNTNNIISRGAGFMQRLFYRMIMPGKNRFNAAFCVGTNVIFRRSAVEHIGGIYQKSKSEDIWTSILLHEAGYKSIFIADILAIGQTPDTIEAYSKQQLRWATGGFQILLKHNPLTKRLTIDQKLQYLNTTTYYLHGFAIFLLLLLPPLHIFFDLSPITLALAFGLWIFYYMAFYGMQVFLAFYSMEKFRPETIILALASFPIYIRAFSNAALNKEEAWQATGNREGINSPFNYIVPQLLMFVFYVFTSLVGIWKVYYYEVFTVALVWCALNTLLFGAFIYIALKEHRSLKNEDKSLEESTKSNAMIDKEVTQGAS